MITAEVYGMSSCKICRWLQKYFFLYLQI